MFFIEKSKGIIYMLEANPIQCLWVQNCHRLDLLSVQQFQVLSCGLIIDLYFLTSHCVYLYCLLSLQDGCNMYLSLISLEQYVAGFATLDVCLQDLHKTKSTKQVINPTMHF